MKLKAVLKDGIPCLATESGEIIENAMKFHMESGILVPTTYQFQITFAVIEDTRTTLPSQTFIDWDYDSDEGPVFHDEDCECEGDIMDGLCPDCAQDLCLQCGQCNTPACEEKQCDCP